MLEFLEGISTRFGTPSTIISNNSKCFVGAHISSWAVEYGKYLKASSNYYPQGNGLVESPNKNLIEIIKRTIEDNQRSWHIKLKIVLWIDKIAPKRAIGNSPFMLVYGRETRLTITWVSLSWIITLARSNGEWCHDS